MKRNKKKILIAGGGYSDIPLIKSAQKLGYYVITSGNRKNDLGHQYSDECHLADYSNPEIIFNLAKSLNVAGICSCCNDFSALSVAYAAEKMDLPGHDSFEVAKIIHHKDKFRQFAIENDITVPWAKGYENKKDAIADIDLFKFPIIVKPVDLTGGKGISTVESSRDIETAIDKAFSVSLTKRIVIEEFVKGTHHGLSAFLYKGRVVFYFSDNEHYYLNPFLVSAASTPSIVSEEIEMKICKESERIASLLNLKDGIFHIQYILKGDKPYIIEICRRAPGDLYIKFVEHATGVDYSSWIVKASVGDDCSGLSNPGPTGYFTRHCIMSNNAGKVKDIQYDPSIKKNIIDQLLWWQKGDLITDVMTSKFGIVFLKFDSQEEMLDKTERLQSLIKVETE